MGWDRLGILERSAYSFNDDLIDLIAFCSFEALLGYQEV
jgi:hypothetical protein